MNVHFPLPKIRTIGNELTLSHSHFSFRHIFALKLAMNVHFPLSKIRTIGNELTLSLTKNSHFSFLPSHFPSLPSRRGHHIVALKFAMSSHFPLPKILSPSLFPLFHMARAARRVIENPRQIIKILGLASPILFFPSRK